MNGKTKTNPWKRKYLQNEEIEKILADAERKAALDKPVEKPTEPTE